MGRVTRVLFLIDELDIGGTEQQLLELVKRLDREKYLPMVCCFRPGRVSAEIEAAGVPLFVLKKRARVDFRLVLALARLMRRERIDLLQTYLFTANTWGRLAAILAAVPIIFSSERNVDIWEERYKQVVGKWLDRWTRVTIANSEAVKHYLTRRGLAQEKIQVVYNGVDLTRFEEPITPDVTKAELGIPLHHAVVGLLARLEPQKDPRTFLQAAAMVAEKNLSVSFLVVGGGSLESDLQEEARELGIAERVIFAGPRRDVPRLLAACDVSVISSLKEGMSNTIMESMAAGKPMVATRVGGNPELIEDGKTGFLVRPRDAAGLALAIQRILEDPELAKTMGLEARARIGGKFSVQAMVAAAEQLYDGAVGSLQRRAAPRGVARPEGDDGGSIAFVASQFPRYVDAYFLREMVGLAARGLRFRIFSLRGFDGTVIHAAARPFLPDTVYAPFLLSWPLLRANARFLARMPVRYIATLLQVIVGSLGHPRGLLRALVVFPKTVYFAELIEQAGIGHVHGAWASHPATSAWVISRLTGASWSFSGHGSDIYIETAMLPRKLRDAAFVVTCTRYNRDYLVGLAGKHSADKVILSYHGVDLQGFKPVPRRAPETFRILTAGTLRDCKGLPDLVHACEILKDRGIAFECSIVGDGPERGRLERLIRRAGLEHRVRITGFVSQEDLIPMYQQASVVVLPALSETHFGIPNILLEALAVETPVICTALPSIGEAMEHGTHGLYVPERAPTDLADALESLVRDPERCRAMGTAGRLKMAELFDAEKNTARLEALFRSRAERPLPLPSRTPSASAEPSISSTVSRRNQL